MTGIDWQRLFGLDVPLLEILIRGTVMYLSIFILLRVILKRESGAVGVADLLVVVLIADAASSGMSGEYKSITSGLLLVVTIIFWSFTLDWLAFQFPWLERVINPQPLPLIKNGEYLRRNMRKEFITLAELEAVLREHGLEDVSQVREAVMESDGRISVVPFENSTGVGSE